MNDPLAQHDPEILAEMDASIRADLDAGIPLEQIIASLEKVGWTREEASAAVTKAYAERLTKIADIQDKYAAKVQKIDKKYRSSAKIRIFTGTFCIVLGVAASIISYRAAKPGGIYFVETGIVGYGALRLLTGISDFRGK